MGIFAGIATAVAGFAMAIAMPGVGAGVAALCLGPGLVSATKSAVGTTKIACKNDPNQN